MALEVYDFTQRAAEIWQRSNPVGKQTVLRAISLNRAVSDVSLCVQKRKPFDILAERPSFVDGRPASQEFESAAGELLAEFLVPTLQNRMLEGLIDSVLEDCEAEAVAEVVA